MKIIVSRPTVPWYNEDIHKAKLLRRKAERKWKKTKRETDFQLFKKRRNHVTHLLNEAKHKFFMDFVVATRTLLGKNRSVIADMDTVPGDPIPSDAKILSEFKSLSDADILALIRKSSKKTCNLDPMPTKLVVESIDRLLLVIAKMINSSLLGGYFPKAWKEALIDPRYKKTGVNDFTNLRPVSYLQYMSKLAERAVFN